MIQSTHKNLVTSPVFTTNSVVLTPNTQFAVDAGTLVPAPVQLQNQAVALPSGPRVSLSAAGEGAYAGAIWPIVGGKNTMSFTTNLAGPGTALTSFTLATTTQSFVLSSPIIDATGNVYIINRVGSSVVLRKYATTSVPFVELWSYTTTTIAFPGTTSEYGYFCPTLGQGVVYFMTTNGLHCVDSNTGALKWVNPLRSFNYNFTAFLMLDSDGNVYGAVRELVFCVAASGVTKWMSTVIQYVNSLALDAATGILYAWCYSVDSGEQQNTCALLLFDHVTGTQLVSTPNTIECEGAGNYLKEHNSPVIIGNEFVYACTGDSLIAFHKRGDVAWVQNSYTWFYLIAYNPRLNLVYFSNAIKSTNDNGVYLGLASADGATGAVVNLVNELITIKSLQCIIDANDQIYVKIGNNIRVYDAALNQLAAQPLPVSTEATLTLNGNGQLYYGTNNGLYVSN